MIRWTPIRQTRPATHPLSQPVLSQPVSQPLRSGVLAFLAIPATALLMLSLPAPRAEAHARSVSYSSWEIAPDGADVSLRIKLLELSRMGPEALPPGTVAGPTRPGAPDLSARAFPRQLVLLADGEPCLAPTMARRRPDEPGWVRYQWRVQCPENPTLLAIRSQILLDVAPSHMHFARVHGQGTSGSAREGVLTEASPELVLRRATRSDEETVIGSRFVDYLELGISHILTGWDHLAFLFGLLLLSTRFGDVARLVTGFTLAHSLTLALAVLDWVHPRSFAVETVIAFSVALVAIEKGWLMSGRSKLLPRSVFVGLGALGIASFFGWTRLPALTVVGLMLFTACYFSLSAHSTGGWVRICLTFAFGLVHGFGFAGVLVEMTLPSDRLVPALLGFNLGVEAGQLGIVMLLWPLISLGRRFSSQPLQHWAAEASAAVLCGVGLYWLVERAFPL